MSRHQVRSLTWATPVPPRVTYSMVTVSLCHVLVKQCMSRYHVTCLTWATPVPPGVTYSMVTVSEVALPARLCL